MAVPRFEAYGGYAYFPETDSLIRSFADSGHGFVGGLGLNFTEHWAGLVEVDTASWTVRDQDVRVSFLSLGPRYTVRIKRLALFGMGTIDFKRSRFSSETIHTITNGVAADVIVPANTATAGGFGFGGGADLNLSQHIALRLIQLNNNVGIWGEGAGRNLRIKTAVVFKFP